MKDVLCDPRSDDEKAAIEKEEYVWLVWCRFVSKLIPDTHKSGSEQLRQSSWDCVGS